jgi:hypothetical protein
VQEHVAAADARLVRGGMPRKKRYSAKRYVNFEEMLTGKDLRALEVLIGMQITRLQGKIYADQQ